MPKSTKTDNKARDIAHIAVLRTYQDLYLECKRQRDLPGTKRNWRRAIMLTDACEQKKLELLQMLD